MSDKKPENEEELKKNPIWMLSPMEEKALLKEHQAWAEKQCEKQYDGRCFIFFLRHVKSPANRSFLYKPLPYAASHLLGLSLGNVTVLSRTSSMVLGKRVLLQCSRSLERSTLIRRLRRRERRKPRLLPLLENKFLQRL